MSAMIALAAASSLFQGIGQLQAARTQANSLKKQARLKELQASETIIRDRQNRFLASEQGEVFKAQQVGAFAKGGVDIGSVSALNALEDTESKILRQNLLKQREANFTATQLRNEASGLRKAARKVKRGGVFGAIGSLFGGAASIASSNVFSSGGGGSTSTGGSSFALNFTGSSNGNIA